MIIRSIQKSRRTVVLFVFLATLFVADNLHDEESSWSSFLSAPATALLFGLDQPKDRRNLRYKETTLSVEDHSSSWRVLNLGTSVSWGAGMTSRYHAYPYLLSPNVTNQALRAQGPNYPAVCTQTVVGDEAHYDLIILEFYLRAQDGLLLLTQRLRQRFPKAVIVIVRRWNPLMIIHKASDGGSDQNLREFLEQQGITSLHAPETREYLFDHTSAQDWRVSTFEDKRQIQDQAVQNHGAILYELPLNEHNPLESVLEHSHWFSSDYNHLSAEGHAFVANGILSLLREKGVTVEQHDDLGTWGLGDQCDTWFFDGHASSSVTYSRHVKMNSFTTSKYALEIPTPPSNSRSDNAGGWITIRNPFPEPRQLVISYMGTDPPSKYPKTRVYLKHHHTDEQYQTTQSLVREVDLDPSITDYKGQGHVHVGLSSPLGTIAPGKTTLFFRSLEYDKEYPFRVIGYAISGEGEALSSNVFNSL